jgi:integrase/recombinase XerD
VTLLRQRMLEDLQIRHYSPTTIRLYLYAVRAFAKHFGKPPDQLGAEHIRRYQLFLTKEKKVSTSTYVMMICGLRFFYTHTLDRKVAIERIPFPRRERKLPIILSRDEVRALLEAPGDLRQRAMLAILYGAGLRVSEVARLKVADIDSGATCSGFVSAKGGKTGKRCCRRSCANCSAATGEPRIPPIGYFLARVRASPSQ